MTKFNSSVWLSNILWCVRIYTHTHTHIYIYIKNTSLFIHLLMDTVCFCILATVNNAAMNIGVHIFLQIIVFVFWIYAQGGVARLFGSSIKFCAKAPYCFPKWHQNLFSYQLCEGSLLSTSSLAFVICVLFDDNHFDRCEVIFHCGFDFYFLDD